MQEKIAPSGELVICTLAMPKDTNANGDIFGGWLVSQMDLGGAILAARISRARVVTVAINQLVFHKAVKIGDTVCCYAKLIKVGNTSMSIHLESWTIPFGEIERQKVTDGLFIYVAVDENRKPTSVTANHPR
jgi:acyl-CoA thioesterase YciA